MKLRNTSILSVIGILTLCTTPLFSDLSASEEKAAATNEVVTSECELPTVFSNAEEFAKVMADPAQFMQFMTLMSNPQTTQMLMNCSTDTEQLNAWMANLGDPSYKMNAAAIFMNPQVYMNWMTAMMNPQTYTAMANFMNPALYMQWMTAASNPAYYQPMYKMMDPQWQQESTAWMMNPNTFSQMMSSFTNGQFFADASAATAK